MFRHIFLFCPLFFLLQAASAQETYQVGFDQPHYGIRKGQEFQAPVLMQPVPAAGLFSYGLICSVESLNGLTGIVSLTSHPALVFDSVLGAGSRAVAAGAGFFSSKGTVDLFLPEKPGHFGQNLGTLAIASLPDGEYTLRLASHNTLGPTESVFVDGDCRALDPMLDFGTAVLTVISKPEGTITALGAMIPDRQTGLLLQEYEVRNTGSIAGMFRILIRNMPAGSKVWNATGTVEGIPYIDLPVSLDPGASAKITIEYRSQDRATVPSPQFELDAADGIIPEVSGAMLALEPRATLRGGAVLLEFNSKAGQNYYIQYSGNLTSWKTALPKIEGTGNRIQWIDNGLPKTDSLPSTAISRFYRIVAADAAPQ